MIGAAVPAPAPAADDAVMPLPLSFNGVNQRNEDGGCAILFGIFVIRHSVYRYRGGSDVSRYANSKGSPSASVICGWGGEGAWVSNWLHKIKRLCILYHCIFIFRVSICLFEIVSDCDDCCASVKW